MGEKKKPAARRVTSSEQRIADETTRIRKGSDTEDLGISTDAAMDAIRKGQQGGAK